MTQLEAARQGNTTEAMQQVAVAEKRTSEFILQGIAEGKIVIPLNPAHAVCRPTGVGTGLKTKVNANLGTSTDCGSAEEELIKAKVAADAGADALMDLSLGGDLVRLRSQLLTGFPQPLGTVPIYEVAVRAREKHDSVQEMTGDDMLQVIRDQAKQGVDFMTIHSGVTQESVERLRSQGRGMDIVSRGGALIGGWMLHHQKENPYYSRFDEILEICRQHDVTLSLGDGLRPGCLDDATDRAQVQELIILGELARRSRDAGVQVMIEGPGHVPLDQIEANIVLEKRLCEGAPFYVLGPLVTDVAAGYDHIACAIGGAIAARAGADFLCYVTPSEHLRLPNAADVREGVIASRIAAHAADIAKGIPGAREWDRAMSKARKELDWDQQIALALDPVKASELRESSKPNKPEVCTMCGDFCAVKGIGDYLKK
ncbi:phosphomethylpyrimidine synthase ThiC [bacterium]|nr:phosphomethylpyrimidine synthase ThiC [bacterium]